MKALYLKSPRFIQFGRNLTQILAKSDIHAVCLFQRYIQINEALNVQLENYMSASGIIGSNIIMLKINKFQVGYV